MSSQQDQSKGGESYIAPGQALFPTFWGELNAPGYRAQLPESQGARPPNLSHSVPAQDLDTFQNIFRRGSYN